MKPQIYLMLMMISMNLAMFTLNESGVYPLMMPYESPSHLMGNFTLPDLIAAGILTMIGIFEIIVRRNASAGLALIAWSMGFFLQASRWVVNGLPELLKLVGVPWYLQTVASVLCGFIFWLFILEITTARDMS